jgi:choline dehydrogenase
MLAGDRYDYVVVGGGSSGCIVAAELSADPSVRVLLLEHGDAAEEHPETLRADGYKDAFANDALVWDRFSTWDERWGARRLFVGSGRGLGGSGSINAMVYTRGAAVDFEEWPASWRWSRVEPDFEAIEARLRPHRREPTEFTSACIEAAKEAGFRAKDDLNDGDLSGVLGYEWMNYEGEERRSSYVAFLEPALSRPNLVVRTRAAVHRLKLDTDGRVAGVSYEHEGEELTALASREVVMCAGALETPRLLMLSGIGPSLALRRVGLPAVHDVPGVGQNLHDHPNVSVFFKSEREIDCYYPQLYGFHRANERSALPRGQSDSCYVFYPARSSLREAMMRVLPGIVLPQALYEIGALPKLVRSGVGLAFESEELRRFVAHVFGIVVILGKPKSRGSIALASSNPRTPAKIDPGYLDDPEDLETMVRGVEIARSIAAAGPLREWGSNELMPARLGAERSALEQWIRKNVMTTYHYAGTCAMGDAASSVADDRLRVRGVPGLRVADASAIPVTPVSAMNAPSMLVGYRAARFIRDERAS